VESQEDGLFPEEFFRTKFSGKRPIAEKQGGFGKD
jgi:hypothetical protein